MIVKIQIMRQVESDIVFVPGCIAMYNLNRLDDLSIGTQVI